MDGIKSKESVKEFGEVFTPDSIVNDMLDLVDEALKEEQLTPEEYLSKTYLEPACGDGQFLVRIIDRKLACIKQFIPKEQQELALVKALSTIYGVDIQEINVIAARKRMLEVIKTGTTKTFDLIGKEIRSFTKLDIDITPDLEKVLQYILDKNIICGDTLNKSGDKEVKITEFVWDGTNVAQKGYMLNNLDMELAYLYVDFKDYKLLGSDEDTDEDPDELGDDF